MGINTNKQRTVLQTDAVLGNEPSRLLVAAMTDEARRRLYELQKLLLTRMLYRQTHSHIPRIDTMSDEEIDRNIYLEAKPVTLFRLDRKTTAERRAGEEAFKKLEAEEKVKKTNQDVLDRGDAIMSVSTDYIPLLGSVLRAGLYNFARLNLGYDYANNRYGYTPLISSAIDVATIPLGVGTKQLAASYAGGIGGRYVGDTYFDSPYAGLFIGTLLGGPVYNAATNVASNANSAYKGFRLGREFNKGINSALFFNTPVEHVSNNGVTIGSTLDIGNEGIHLSPVGSSTTPRVELFLLNLGQFPYVRRGIWTFTNNTAPVEVKDLGYFGRGFNKDFDTKVDNGFKNFVYSNNYEGKFGDKRNVSFLTMDPSHNLLLSNNILMNYASPPEGTFRTWLTPELPTLFLGHDRTFYPSLEYLEYLRTLPEEDAQFMLDLFSRGSRYLVTPEEAKSSDILMEISKMTGEQLDKFFIDNIDRSLELMHARGKTGGYDRLRHNLKLALDEIGLYNPAMRNVVEKLIDAKVSPRYYDKTSSNPIFDYERFWMDLTPGERLLLDKYVTLSLHLSDLPLLGANLTDEGITAIYNAPVLFDISQSGNAAAVPITGTLYEGVDKRLTNPTSKTVKTKAHEIHHLFSSPYLKMPDDMNRSLFYGNIPYLLENVRGAESTARYSLLLNWFGIDNGQRVLTPTEFNFAARSYLGTPYPHINNSMNYFFSLFDNNSENFIKWAAPTALTTLPFILNGSQD